ncbi:OB-fold domain-containing protein [Jatrophihabitans telluris]|uniref:OB-fold domain-containing protein n=1 Tax=Jatrophihabitans telluris TaxID=2038343 RepID=A0ABY4R163_9ACTN|nr:OB-fold domain-containing protein [Jatrophihabitans telluris]
MSRALKWEALSGDAHVYSYAIVHKSPPGFSSEVPYVVGLVDLVEGVRMMTRLVDCPVEEIRIDMAVSVTYRDFGHEWLMPCFAPQHGVTGAGQRAR